MTLKNYAHCFSRICRIFLNLIDKSIKSIVQYARCQQTRMFTFPLFPHLRNAAQKCWIYLKPFAVKHDIKETRNKSLTVTVVHFGRPPDHAVSLPVPHALDHLVHQHLLPGGGLTWAGVCYRVSQLPLLVRPSNFHSHVGGGDCQSAASCWIQNYVWVFQLDTYEYTRAVF